MITTIGCKVWSQITYNILILANKHPYYSMEDLLSLVYIGGGGNQTLQRGRIFLLVQFKKRVPDHEGRPAGQRQSGAGAGKRFLVLFRIIEQDQELVEVNLV